MSRFGIFCGKSGRLRSALVLSTYLVRVRARARARVRVRVRARVRGGVRVRARLARQPGDDAL